MQRFLRGSTRPPSTRVSSVGLAAAALFLAASGAALEAQPSETGPRRVHIGVVTDGPTERDAGLETAFRREILALLEGEFEVSDEVVDGDWTVSGVEAIFDRMLTDPEIDVVLTPGLIASSIAIQRGALPKPVIAPYVVDGQLQGAPLEAGASGVRNLVYVTNPPMLVEDLRTLRELAGFERVVLVGPATAPVAADHVMRNTERVAAELGIRIDVVVSGGSAETTLERIPEDTQAVYLVPLLRLESAEIRALAEGLIERGIPSLSAFWPDVELGILATNVETAEPDRLARRVALNLQRILLGEDAGTLPVTFERRIKLTVNMLTARAIGVYPSFAMESDANLINVERRRVTRVLSLSGVVHEAMAGNLDLRSFERTVAASREDVREARASLLPQLDFSALGVVIDSDRASIFQSERTASASLGLSQLLYSDRAWANFDVQRDVMSSREQELAQLRLDTTLAAASAYLNVLRAKTVERISRDNLQLTRQNLERARTRVQIGMANRSEVYRWESELAGNRAEVIQAGANRNVAEIELNRILNSPPEEPFLTTELGLEDPTLITSDARVTAFLHDRWIFRVFRAFNVLEAFGNSPELKQLDAAIRAQERALLSTKRAFFVPDVALQAQLDNRFYEGGAASDDPRLFDTWDWQVGIQASIPLFTSGARGAARARAEQELERLRTDRSAVALRIEQRVRSALHQAGSSFAGIDLARQAAAAARKGLELVSDSYARGAVSIIDLLDAQNTAFVAELAAANALYGFLLDLVEAERAVGKFDFFSTPEERAAYFDRLERFVGERQPESRQ